MNTHAAVPSAAQPESFEFTAQNLEKAKAHIAKYPPGRQQSAVLPLLDLAQRQHGWVPIAAMNHVAELLGMPRIRVYGMMAQSVATVWSTRALARKARQLRERIQL